MDYILGVRERGAKEVSEIVMADQTHQTSSVLLVLSQKASRRILLAIGAALPHLAAPEADVIGVLGRGMSHERGAGLNKKTGRAIC